MGTGITDPQPPPGFVPEDSLPQADPQPPPGFVPEDGNLPEPPPPAGFQPAGEGWRNPENTSEVLARSAGGFVSGVVRAGQQQLQTSELLQGQPVSSTAPPENAGELPLQFGMPDANTLPKLSHAIGESVPSISAATSVGLATTELTGNPLAGLVAGSLTMGAASMYQGLGPYFKVELDKTPNDREGAFDRAVKQASIDGAFGLATYGLTAVPILKGPVRDLLFKNIVAQPLAGGAQRATQNLATGRPVGEGTLDATAGGFGQGVALTGGHGALRTLAGKSFFPTAEDLGGGPKPGDPGSDIPPPPPGFEPELPGGGGDGGVTAESVPTQERFKARPELSNVPQTIDPATQQPDQQISTVFRGQMGSPDGFTAFDAAQEARRAAKFQNGKIAKENDNSQPLTSADQGYNDAVLAQRGDVQPDAVSPTNDIVPFPSGRGTPTAKAVGSVAQMRSKIAGVERAQEDSTTPPAIPAATDVAEVGPSLETLIAHTRELADRQYLQDLQARNRYDANEPRYVLDGGSDFHLYNATDLEAALAIRGNQPRKPLIEQVRLDTLDQDKITAGIHDLPPWNDRRVDLGSVDRAAYEQMRQRVDMEAYHQMINEQGLRVVPGAGATHMYSGGYDVVKTLDAPPPSSRSHFVRGILPDGGDILMNTEGARIGLTEGSNNIGFQTVDVRKLDPEHFVSGDYGDAANLRRRDGKPVDQFDQQMWKIAAMAHDWNTIKELAKDGVYAPVRYDGGDFGGSHVLAIKPIPREAITRGYAPVGKENKTLTGDMAITRKVYRKDSEIELEGAGGEVKIEPMQARLAHDIVEAIVDVKPVVDRILQRFGAKARMKYIVSFSNVEDSPYIHVDRGEIVFPVDAMQKLLATRGYFGTRKQAVQQIVFHELGHLVTMRSWDLTPPDMQELIRGAYNRALFSYNLDGSGAPQNSLIENPNRMDDVYYLTFREWHAEQFRRWTSTDAQTLTDIDKYFKRGAKDLLDVQDAVSDKWGDAIRNQMFQSDWSFNTWMDYIERAAHSGDTPLQFMKRISDMAVEAPKAGKLEEVNAALDAAMEEFGHTIAADIQVVRDANSNIDFESGRGGFASFNKGTRRLRFMMGTMAWIKERKDLDVMARNALLHEAWHGIEDSLPPEANDILLAEAKKEKILSAKDANYYGREAEKFYLQQGKTKEEAKRLAIDHVNREWRAKLAELSHHGFRFGDQAQGILDKFSAFIERMGNFLRGKGFNSATDILHEFYRGEITDRYNRALKQAQFEEPSQQMHTDISNPTITNKRGEVFRVQKEVKPRIGLDPQTRYGVYDKDGNLAAYVLHDSRGEIEMMKVSQRKYLGTGLAETMIRHAEADRGEPFKSAQLLTDAGYNAIKRYEPGRVKYYVKSDGFWMSPKSIWEMVANMRSSMERAATPEEKSSLQRSLSYYEDLAKQIPDTAHEDPVLQKQWMSRSFQMDEWQKAAQQRNDELKQRVTGDTSGQTEDPYLQAARIRKMEAQDKSELGAEPQPEMYMIRGVFRRFGVQNEPQMGARGRVYDQDTTWSLHLWGNKMISLGKSALTIRQLAWINPRLQQLRDYVSYRDQQQQRTMATIARAHDTAAAWDRLPDAQRNGLSDMLFWATEMRYRTRQEVAQRVTRMPTMAELTAYARAHGLGADAFNLYHRVAGDFANYLTDMERVFTEQIMRRFSGPTQLQTRNTELANLAADMANLRAKPYFPMVRFGRYSLTARDPQNNRVTYFELFNTPAQRDAAYARMQAQHPLNDWSINMVPEGAFDFMGLPKPLLDRIKAQLPGITQAQRDWMDQFANLMSPQNSFKKRWLERRGTPGYSLDGIRAYAQYFRSGARYLSRIEFNDQIRDVQRSLEQSAQAAVDGTQRRIISDIVNDHAKWMDAPGKDWTKIKALTTIWQLGFSPVAAFMNLTQVPQVTYPYLSSLFGEKAVFTLGSGIAKAGARVLWTRSQGQMQAQANGLHLAHDEMVRQGKIDLGQAAELGTFADSDTLNRSYAGVQADKALRNYGYLSMFMFANTERFNREWTFETAYKLALQDPNNQHVRDMSQYAHREINDLVGRTGMTQEQATAFIVAREAIDRTQYSYSAWDRPKFLRVDNSKASKVFSASRIFFMFTQQQIFALAANPGRLKMALIMGALYGVMGLPGAEDIDALVHGIAAKIFGKDWSPSKAARQMVRDQTRGTFLDKTGPDIFLHGISRYGFGMDLLSDHMGWPQFDASANGSMGRVIPGLASAAEGWANSGADQGAWQSMSAKVMQDWAGPGLGTFFPFLKWATATPTTGEAHKWETVMPRAFKSMAQAWHMYADGGVRDQNGNLQVKMDWNDPNDRATIIAKALGFQPRAVNERFEQQQMINSTEQFYKAQKMSLTADMYVAIKNKDAQMRQEVISKVLDYNKRVMQLKRPDLVLNNQGLVQSINERLRKSTMAEGQVPNKSQLFQQGQYGDLFPGMQQGPQSGPQGSPQVIDQRRVK